MTTGAPVPALPRPSRLAVVLSAIIIAAYFGFILLASLARAFMGAVPFPGLLPGVSVGILLAALVLVLCMALSSIFVVVANRDRTGA